MVAGSLTSPGSDVPCVTTNGSSTGRTIPRARASSSVSSGFVVAFNTTCSPSLIVVCSAESVTAIWACAGAVANRDSAASSSASAGRRPRRRARRRPGRGSGWDGEPAEGAGSSAPARRRAQVMAAGRWPLAAGRWPLAAGRWPLAAGRWPLAIIPARSGGRRQVPTHEPGRSPGSGGRGRLAGQSRIPVRTGGRQSVQHLKHGLLPSTARADPAPPARGCRCPVGPQCARERRQMHPLFDRATCDYRK